MTISLDAIVQDLNARYPCREPQFSALASVIGHSSLPSPPALCLTGFPATGKSTITRAFLDATNTTNAWVDCSETISSALLFDRIVDSLKVLSGQEVSRMKMSGGINNFVVEVHLAMDALKDKVILVFSLSK